VRKYIRKFLSKKRNVVALAVIAAALVFSIIYTIVGIDQSLQIMTEANEDEQGVTPYFPSYPPVNTEGKDPTLIQRGEYLAKAGDCMACHTNSPEKGQPFAGGLPMQTPFGTIYSPNITPDKQTGIGNWTDEQFIKAMHKGISPKGYYYYPAFPYLYFSTVSTDDLKAIKAYLDSIPAVHQENRKNEMIWPFNRRLLQLPWRLMFFHPTQYHAVRQESDLWKRGAYLVEGLGHCAMCHTPSYHIFSDNLSLGAPMNKYEFTGAKIQGYLAPNISKSNLANATDQEIVEVFTKDHLIGGGNVQGPMLEVNHDSLRYLTNSDLLAITTYLKSVQSATPPKPKVGKGGIGKATYEMYCSGCHATGAGGAPKYGEPSDWDARLKNGINKVYGNAINGVGGMPAKGTCLSCSDDDIKQAVNYMVASVTGASAKMTRIPKQKKLTIADGEQIYAANCSVCHNNGFKNAPKPGDKAAWKPYVNAGVITVYEDVVYGKQGHVVNGGCPSCTDAQLKAAIKYMLQTSSDEDFNLW